MFDLDLAMDASKNPDNYERGDLYRATVLLGAEVVSLRAAVERVREFCDDLQVPAVHGTYEGGYQAAREDMRRALDGEA